MTEKFILYNPLIVTDFMHRQCRDYFNIYNTFER